MTIACAMPISSIAARTEFQRSEPASFDGKLAAISEERPRLK